MNFIDRIFGVQADRTELLDLRRRYQMNSCELRRSQQWYMISGSNNRIAGFLWACQCGQEYKLMSPDLWLIAQQCPTCKHRFDLIHDIGADKLPRQEWSREFAKLPVRQTGGQQPQKRVMDIWDEAGDPSTEYEPSNVNFT